MKNDLNNLRIHLPRMLKLRGSLADLETSMIGRITAGFLDHLQGSDDQGSGLRDYARQCLSENRIIFDDNADRLGVTRFANNLLLDNDSHFEDFVLRTYDARGFEPARHRIANMANGALSGERMSAEAAALTNAMQSRIDRQATTLAGRRQWLAGAVEQISEIAERIDTELAENIENRALLERDRDNARKARDAQAAPRAAQSLFMRLRGVLFWLLSVFKNTSAQPPVSNHALENIIGGIEKEMLRVMLRQVLLEAERTLCTSLLNALEDEGSRCDSASIALGNAARGRELAAKIAEASRGWNVGAGEITLNDSALTGTVIDYLWPDRSVLWETIRSSYVASKGQEIWVITEGVFQQADFDDVETIVRDHVVESLRDWTLVDSIAARCQAGDGLARTIKEAFRQVASRDFLTLGYDRFIPHRTYAVVAYADSKNAESNSIFDSVLEDAARVVDAELDFEIDDFDRDTVTFYIEDQSVPITAMDFFAKSAAVYERNNMKRSPLFVPHPDLYNDISTPREYHRHSYGNALRIIAEIAGLRVTDTVNQANLETPTSIKHESDQKSAIDEDGFIPVDGRLGAYAPHERVIELYLGQIRETAKLLDVRAEALEFVVGLHEAAHAVVHLGRDIDGENFDTQSFLRVDDGAEPSPLHETFAQLLCFAAVKNDSELRLCFDKLNQRQPEVYRHWETFQSLTAEQIRAALLAIRRAEVEGRFDAFAESIQHLL